ncbi:hypothetical protein T492DRAFT_838489 [Pavlovales sp. CCMP2436]|nr:hypothetical protein T492DRAFT_838489 [Pavlovales sp. CCMP2436]
MADPLALLKAASGGLPEVAEVAALPAADKHSLCLQVLTDGYVQSFVDFFYLTHKPDTSASHEDEEPSSEPDRLVLPAEHLEFVRASLCEAEAARRQSETKAYQAYARLMERSGDLPTALAYHQRCLQGAQESEDKVVICSMLLGWGRCWD